ncbi:MAG: aldehyde ferredoxin oxidoreductase N-terminal domain-containing protein [Thermodesulfobacteriota bacterium]|nr:aldehyde ferredoxin oxidoreductase N-terminal domain-containing protein [Thermodesulfobacteriota bacterium]
MGEIKFNLLEIDLTTGEKKTVDITEEVCKYLGGRGLGAKILWDRVSEGIDPLSPENILYFGLGPLTGFMGSVTNVSAISPLTLLRGQSNVNGHFGVELIYAGYNAGLLLTGKADRPVYIYIKDDDVEVRDASHLWGLYNPQNQQALLKELKKELDDQNFRIVSIGPAGEHLVRNASIDHDFYHHAARLGMGAVMGSKNVKAIAVRGTKSPPYPKPELLYHLLLKWLKEEKGEKVRRRRWGHSVSIPDRYYETKEGIKNKQLGWDPICDLSNPLRLEQGAKLWSDACNLCQVGCKVPYMRRKPPYAPTIGEIRHDNAGGWNANTMIPGYDVQTYLSTYVDTLGLDSEDVSGVVAWMMECYDRGLITKEDLGGIELTWGNVEAICKLLKKIAFREGVGDRLADGLKFAPEMINKTAKKYAMTHKGVAITSYEPRGSMSDAIGLVLNPVGELHGGRGTPERIIYDSLTTCSFLRRVIIKTFGSLGNLARPMLEGACGWKLTEKDWSHLILRASIMERCVSIREGYVPSRDDILPDRFFDEVIHSKYGEPKVLDREQFLEARRKTYIGFGLNEDGIPSKKTLQDIDMEFVIPVLEKKLGPVP